MRMDRDAKGRISVAPMTGFGLVLVAESVCMLRLEFVRTREQQLNGTPESVQLALTPAQAQALAAALVATAKEGYAAPPDAVVN
jgi:hypothetical protein